MINRKNEIKQRDFSINIVDDDRARDFTSFLPVDFSKIKIGAKTLKDATYDLGELQKVNKRMADKGTVLKAINECRFAEMREISNFFYKTSGIYSRLCRYMAYLYRYD